MGGSDLPDIRAEFSDEPFVRGTLGMARSQHPDERRRRRPIRDEVDPEKLYRDQTLRNAERGGEEDAHNFADVRRDHVSNERLHVVVDTSSLRDGFDDEIGRASCRERV